MTWYIVRIIVNYYLSNKEYIKILRFDYFFSIKFETPIKNVCNFSLNFFFESKKNNL